MRLDDLFDRGARGDAPAVVGNRVLTAPNVLSVLRLLFLPFVYGDILGDRPVRALVLLFVLSATDWVDGYVARRFDQVSKLGQVLDPISDRIFIAVVAVAFGVAGIVPWWALALILARDVLVGAVGLLVLSRGAATPPVTRTGKAATFGLMGTLSTFLLAEALAPGAREALRAVCWVGLGTALVLYYAAAVQYARWLAAARIPAETPAALED